MTHPQQQLIAKWRAEAKRDLASKKDRQGNITSCSGAVHVLDQCANELEAALSAGQDKPLPPDVLADALQDRIGASSGRLLSASPIRQAGAVPQQEPQERTPTALDETWRAMGIQTIAQSELNATNSAALETERAKRHAPAVPALPAPQEQDEKS